MQRWRLSMGITIRILGILPTLTANMSYLVPVKTNVSQKAVGDEARVTTSKDRVCLLSIIECIEWDH